MRIQAFAPVIIIFLAGCAHSVAPIASAQATVIPNVVQNGGSAPEFVAFAAPASAFIARGFSTHEWLSENTGGLHGNTVDEIGLDGALTSFHTPTSPSGPQGLTTGPRGSLWIAESAGKVAELSMPGHVFTEFALPAGSHPTAIAAGPDGNLWLADAANHVDKMTPQGVTTVFSVPGVTSITDVTAGPDGNVWCTAILTEGSSSTGMICRITPPGSISVFGIDHVQLDTVPLGIVTGSDGELWVVMAASDGTGVLGQFFSTGAEHVVSSIRASSSSIAAGSNGNLFFNQIGSAKLGVSSTASHIRYIDLPTANTTVSDLASGPDGNIWMTAADGPGSEVLVYVLRVMSVMPPNITFTSVGQMQTITISERGYHRTWTAQSSNTNVATVSLGSGADQFVVTAVGSGTCTITVSDLTGNSIAVPVTVR